MGDCWRKEIVREGLRSRSNSSQVFVNSGRRIEAWMDERVRQQLEGILPP